MARPSRDATLLRVAEVMGDRSTCSRNLVGVVIARDGRILSTGYNGAPAGMPHCNHECNCGGKHLGGTPLQGRWHDQTCSSIRPCTIAIHAEANAIAYAARFGVDIEGAELFTTLSPCVPCSQLIIASGIVRVVYGRAYRIADGLTLLCQADIVVGT